jgi:hypothetical protein
MEKEPIPCKLIDVVSADYPDATEILVSFPNEWELVNQIKHRDAKFYMAAMPSRQERPRPDQFHGLSPEINLQLNTYRMYRFFEPWPMPTIIVAWDEDTGECWVEGERDPKVQLNLLGQAQAWLGQKVAVLWEAYLNEATKIRLDLDKNLIYQFWKAVEDDVGVSKIFTQPHELTWEHGYTDFLGEMGYGPDQKYSKWWSKQKPT